MRILKSNPSLTSLLAGASALLISMPAWAQPSDMMVDPGGTVAAPPEEEAPPSAPAGNFGFEGEATAAPDRFYGDFDLDFDGEDDNYQDQGPAFQGVVPTTHTVKRGDTLWDISAYYMRTPWDWPKIWALNPEIKDPHWIYPGNLIRLRQGGEQVATIGSDPADGGEPSGFKPLDIPGRVYGLKQIAYIDADDLNDAGTIDGSVDEKSLLSEGDSVYIDYEGAGMPKVGDTFAVYTKGKKVKRDKKTVGHYVVVSGELRVTFVQEGKRARAVVTSSVRPMERGMRVGPLELSFANVKPVTNEQKVDGTIVDLISPDELIGAEAAVMIDRGTADGVKAGNRFLVIRRGDAYRKVMRPNANTGQVDEDYPARAIGEVIILQAGEQVSLGVVSFSVHEFGVGDRVFMRKGQ